MSCTKWSVALVAVGLAAASIHAFAIEVSPADEESAIASLGVLDVTMESGAESSDNWAMGLADLLDLELQKKGLTTCERRDIRYVIGERQLQVPGQIGDIESLRDFLPWVRYLVKGSVRRSDGGFVLAVSIVDVRTGQIVTSIEEKGGLPTDLVAALGRVADRVASSLAAAPAAAVRRVGIPGFTDTPEVALLYYKGVEHLLSGRPGYAIRDFTEAAKADPSFMLARWWKMKTYQEVGLPRHARAALDEITVSGLGAGFLESLRGQGATGPVRRLVAVIPDKDAGEGGRRLAGLLSERLRSSGGISLFDPSWLPNLGAEADLDLSGLFERDPYLRSTVWAFTDVMAFILPQPNGGWKLVVRDSLSGEERASTAIADSPASVDRAAAVVTGALCLGSGRVGREGPPFVKTSSPARPAGMESDLDRTAALDELLGRIARNDEPRRALMKLAEWYGNREAPYQWASWETLMDTIDPSEPDAAMWYSTALWNLHDHVLKSRMDITDHFRIVFEKYPESVPAMFCRYSLACYYLERVAPGPDPALAAEILVPLADKMAASLPSEFRTPQLIGSIYYRTAQACEGSGQTNLASANLEKARLATAGADESLRLWYRIGLGYDSDLNPELLYGIYAVAHAKHGNRLADNIRGMGERLAGRSDDVDPADDAAIPLEELGAKADRSTGPDTYRLRRLYVERVDRGDAGESGVQQAKARTVRYINWLYARTWTQAQRDDLRPVAEAAARRLGVLDSVDFALAVGNYDEAARRAGERTKTIICLADGYPAMVRKLLADLRTRPGLADGARATLVADACLDVGLFNDAAHLYEEAFSGAPPKSDWRFKIALAWAHCEILLGDSHKASELLRQIVAEDSNAAPDSPLRLRALQQLRNLRIADDEPARCADWLRFNEPRYKHAASGGFTWVPPLDPAGVPPVEDDLYQILRTHWSYSAERGATMDIIDHAAIDSFVAKYGGDAVPFTIKASERTGLGMLDIAPVLEILEKAAGPAWKGEILDAFRHDPMLAEIAFNLDAQAAEEITKERLPALRGSAMPGRVADAVIAHRVTNAYPFLFRSIADGTVPVHMIASSLGAALEGADTNLVAQFRFALSAFLGDALRRDDAWTAPGGGILSVFEVAMQYGVVEGVHGLVEFHYAIMTDAEKYKMLSPYVELPTDPAEALAALKACGDCLRWDPAVRKFRMADNARDTAKE